MATAEYIFICTLLVIGGVCFVIWLPLFIYNVFNEIKMYRQPNATIKKMKKYIDLGLPSGTLWKNSNEYGGFYTYDEAVAQFGDKLPTKEQLEELKTKCSWHWTGSGYKVTGPNGNFITLPAEGFRDCNGSTGSVGSYGSYWSSTPKGSGEAWDLNFNSSSVGMYSSSRCYGGSVRLVKRKTTKK